MVVSKIFCLTGPKNFVRGPFCISENFGYRKILCIRRGYHYSPLKIFCLTIPKKFVGEPFCFKKNLVSKILMPKRGGHHGFVSQDRNEKLGKGTLLFSSEFLVTKKFYG